MQGKAGVGTMISAKVFFREHNARIHETYKGGIELRELARIFSLLEKSILSIFLIINQNNLISNLMQEFL